MDTKIHLINYFSRNLMVRLVLYYNVFNFMFKLKTTGAVVLAITIHLLDVQ